jgi:uncharacterized protein YdcH (DUF465 family)
MIQKRGSENLIEKVKSENEEFRVLYLEHHELEKKLSELNKSKYLTTEKDIEKKRLQKIKLSGKDRMSKILKQYEEN